MQERGTRSTKNIPLKNTFQIRIVSKNILKREIKPQIMLINDKTFIGKIKKNIKNKLRCADWAIFEEYLEIKSSFDEMQDAYIKQRIEDIYHVVKMLVKNIRHSKSKKISLASLNGYIVVTDDLSPADVLIAHQSKCSALISEFGGRSSHSSILSRGLEIPSLVGVKNALSVIKDDDEVIIDGNKGVIIINPDIESQKHYQKIQRDDKERDKLLSNIMLKESLSIDNKRVELMANLELPEEIKILSNKKFDGIGLFRTEYLFTDRAVLKY